MRFITAVALTIYYPIAREKTSVLQGSSAGTEILKPIRYQSTLLRFLEFDVDEPEFACLLLANGDDGASIYWNGPSLLSRRARGC